LSDHHICCVLSRSCSAVVLMPGSVGIAAFPVGSEGWLASKLASLSAASFPSMSECPRAHLIETSWVSIAPWHSRKAHCEVEDRLPLRHHMTEVLSIHSQIRRVLRVSCLIVCWRPLHAPTASASKTCDVGLRDPRPLCGCFLLWYTTNP
jgi:hypothetical protein